jgi:phytoene dehydrogenase-like protein
MLGHTGVLFTPQAKRISGLNEVTNADPSLAPGNKHLMMSYQVLDPSKNVEKEIKLGIKDLHKIFPDFDKYCDILLIQTYKNDWPVNRALSGFHIDPVSPLKGLYYVGDAIKPTGWMETEGVAKGVEIAIEKIG